MRVMLCRSPEYTADVGTHKVFVYFGDRYSLADTIEMTRIVGISPKDYIGHGSPVVYSIGPSCASISKYSSSWYDSLGLSLNTALCAHASSGVKYLIGSPYTSRPSDPTTSSRNTSLLSRANSYSASISCFL